MNETPTRALSLRQPHAEAIIRGIKKIEYRKRPTNIRGRIFIYASQTRNSKEEEAEAMDFYGIDDVDCDELPRGVVVGTVELHDSKGKKWQLRKPERAKKLRKPTGRPQPVWFRPF